MHRTVLLGALAVLLAVPAQAALNGNHPYEATLPYQAGLNPPAGSPFTLLSGALDAELVGVRGPFGFFQSGEEARLTGLTQVCFQAKCPHKSPGGQLSIVVAAGGSFGVRFPQPVDATARADHALGIVADFAGKRDLNSLALGKTLLAPAVGGSFTFTQLPAIPTTASPDAISDRPTAGGLVALDGKTTVKVLDGTTVVATFPAGKQDPIAFQGTPALGALRPGLMVLPFEKGSTAHLSRAGQAAADAGLDLSRVTAMSGQLANASKSGGSGGTPKLDFGPFQPLLSRVLNGALLGFSPGANASATNVVRQLSLVRFGTLDAESDGAQVALSGAGPLQVQDGRVVAAPSLVGFAVFQMPWWSYVLWVAAIGVFVARLVVKPPKDDPKLDRYRWVGTLCTALLFLLFLWLWDLEVRAVWGVSLLSGGVSGEAFLAVAALELLPLLMVLFAVVTPIRIILRNGTLLLRRGRLMGLPAAFAYPIGFLLGAPLLLAYLNLALKAAAGT